MPKLLHANDLILQVTCKRSHISYVHLQAFIVGSTQKKHSTVYTDGSTSKKNIDKTLFLCIFSQPFSLFVPRFIVEYKFNVSKLEPVVAKVCV